MFSTKFRIHFNRVIDEIRPLFLSYDYCHLTKNVRNQFLDRNFLLNKEEISAKYIRKIYERQKTSLAVPVRGLNNKVVNFEKLNTKKSLQR